MNKAIIGRKLGMTQYFAPDGTVVPVTVVEAGPCAVTQVKTLANDGYAAVQMAFGDVKEKQVTKPMAGHFKKAGVPAARILREFRLENAESYEVGKVVKCDSFEAGDVVDVSGTTKGRGYTGVIKRWNQHRLKETHGVGPVHREVGSMGANSSQLRHHPERRQNPKEISGE